MPFYLPCTMVGLDRLELSTSVLSGPRSNHLSYRPMVRLIISTLPQASKGPAAQARVFRLLLLRLASTSSPSLHPQPSGINIQGSKSPASTSPPPLDSGLRRNDGGLPVGASWSLPGELKEQSAQPMPLPPCRWPPSPLLPKALSFPAGTAFCLSSFSLGIGSYVDPFLGPAISTASAPAGRTAGPGRPVLSQ